MSVLRVRPRRSRKPATASVWPRTRLELLLRRGRDVAVDDEVGREPHEDARLHEVRHEAVDDRGFVPTERREHRRVLGGSKPAVAVSASEIFAANDAASPERSAAFAPGGTTRSPSSASFFAGRERRDPAVDGGGREAPAEALRELALARTRADAAPLFFRSAKSGRARVSARPTRRAGVRVERGRDAESAVRERDERVEEARGGGRRRRRGARARRAAVRPAGPASRRKRSARSFSSPGVERTESARSTSAPAPAPEARAPGVEHAPAADRLGGRRPAEDEAVAGARGERRLERDLREAGRARAEARPRRSFGTRPEAVNAARDVGRAEMDAQARAVRERRPRRTAATSPRPSGRTTASSAPRATRACPRRRSRARRRRGSGSSARRRRRSSRSSPCTSTRRTRTSSPSGKSVSGSSTAMRPAVERSRHDGPEALHREGAVEEEARPCRGPVLARRRAPRPRRGGGA